MDMRLSYKIFVKKLNKFSHRRFMFSFVPSVFIIPASTSLMHLHKYLVHNQVLTSWIKRAQLDVTCFIISLFTAQHVSDVKTSILMSLRLIWWVISRVVLFWYDVCWCYGVLRPNHNVTPTHIVPEQYNPWNNSSNKSQAHEDGCFNIRNMLSSK